LIKRRSAPPPGYSQFGEDLQILDFFGRSVPGVFLDVGANDGVRDSNTLLLEEHGWTGVLVEANPELAQASTQRRSRSTVINCIVGASGTAGTSVFYKVSGGPEHLNGLSSIYPTRWMLDLVEAYRGRVDSTVVPTATLDDILRTTSLPRPPDFVSLDIEGAEFEALRGFDLGVYRPRLLIIEDNSRGIDRRILDHVRRFGYHRVHRTGVNDWYVRQQDLSRFRRQRLLLFLRLLKWRIKQ